MAKVFANRVKVNTSTTGTGTITLGTSVSGYQTFAEGGVVNTNTVSYVIEDGDNWEIGTGTYTSSGTTLSRTVVESNNSNQAINLSGTAVVFISAVSGDYVPTTGGTMTGAITIDRSTESDMTPSLSIDQSGLKVMTSGSKTIGKEFTLNYAFDETGLTGHNHLYGNRNTFQKTGGQVATHSGNVYHWGNYTSFSWVDTDTVKQYISSTDNFSYLGGNLNGQTTSSISAFATTLAPQDNLNQTISNLKSVNTTLKHAGAVDKTINITNLKTDDLPYIQIKTNQSTAGKLTANITNVIFGGYDSNCKINTSSRDTVANQVDATITNLYGLHLPNFNSSFDDVTITNEWGIYQERTAAKNLFAGNTGFNTTTPSEKIDVDGNIAVTGTVDGRDVATDGTKLDAIEANATADQTASEIRTLVESATDSNVFTDTDHTKLDGIATSANNYTHPDHSGEVTSTGDGATVIADNVVDEANLKVSNAPTNGYVLTAQSGNTGGLTWAAASGGGSSTLDGLSDVSTSGVTSGQVLKYNGTNWTPASDNTGSGGGITTGKAIAMAMVFG